MIKKLLILLLAACSHLSFANQEIEEKIQESLWQKRIILLFDNNQNAAENQLNQWKNVDFNEWDILIIKISQNNSSLKEKYQVDKDKTISILIGKDGSEKWRSNSLVDFSVLESLIAKMPMRINEKSKQ